LVCRRHPLVEHSYELLISSSPAAGRRKAGTLVWSVRLAEDESLTWQPRGYRTLRATYSPSSLKSPRLTSSLRSIDGRRGPKPGYRMFWRRLCNILSPLRSRTGGKRLASNSAEQLCGY